MRWKEASNAKHRRRNSSSIEMEKFALTKTCRTLAGTNVCSPWKRTGGTKRVINVVALIKQTPLRCSVCLMSVAITRSEFPIGNLSVWTHLRAGFSNSIDIPILFPVYRPQCILLMIILIPYFLYSLITSFMYLNVFEKILSPILEDHLSYRPLTT